MDRDLRDRELERKTELETVRNDWLNEKSDTHRVRNRELERKTELETVWNDWLSEGSGVTIARPRF